MQGIDDAAWLWGLAGAFLYAAPRLVLCLQSGDGHSWRSCVATFAIAMAAGPIMAESLGPWLGYRFPWMALPDGRALFVTIGLTGNPAAPLIIAVVRGHIRRYAAPRETAE